ncbi:down syndrome cell adhesion molecule [Trichonephila clavipes]|nr:down syndrome cell adhesion molecule [Trichonephila clavipes]
MQPPPASGIHGKIRGYYVGHKVRNSQDHLIYKTIEESEFDTTLECTITNLRRATEYSVLVQAFNNRGTGPPSKEIYVKTHENDNLVALHFKYDQTRRRFVEWAQNEIAIVPDFHMRILFSDEAHFCLNGYVNKQNCRIWSEANPQVYVETPLHPEKLTV